MKSTPKNQGEMSSASVAPKAPEVNRRDFLKGMGAAVAGAGVLAACAPAPAAIGIPQKWDKEADLVLIGTGTGLVGALAALTKGAKVIILEKQEIAGGHTAVSGGWAWIPNNSVMKAEGIQDSREAALSYCKMVAQGSCDDEVIEAFVDRGPEMVDFVAANGIVWGIQWHTRRSTDYYPQFPGYVPLGRSLVRYENGKPAAVHGGPLQQGLLEAIQERGGELLLKTAATKLIIRMLPDLSHEILGVVADSDGTEITIKARKGVLMAAGGFEWDPVLKQHFLRGPTLYQASSPSCTGDGLRMGMAVGADLRNMTHVLGYSMYKEIAAEENAQRLPAFKGMGAQSDMQKPGVIMVNRYGERFCNEGGNYNEKWKTYFAFENWGALGHRNLPAFIIAGQSARDKYKIAGSAAGDPLPKGMKQADSLRELATALGIDPDGLERNVAEFNENARQGKDPRFHRGENLYDQGWGDASFEGPAASLATVETPPFYGIEVAPGCLGTGGGPRINRNAQVVTPFGQPIPRLYCSGNNAGVGFLGTGYGGGGASIGPGMTFAYIAGQHAASLEPWT